jgi:hypothetical protein
MTAYVDGKEVQALRVNVWTLWAKFMEGREYNPANFTLMQVSQSGQALTNNGEGWVVTDEP